VLGYFCPVKPKGFIVVSLDKMLAPVKAYSAVSELDPDSDQGLADLIKGGMERVLGSIEKKIGPIREARAADLERILEINHRQAWEKLGKSQMLREGGGAPVLEMNYQEGRVLTTSQWSQDEPYNNQCPDLHCPPLPDYTTNGRAWAGCVAIAGAQVMRYWDWPPAYIINGNTIWPDWRNMPDILTNSPPQAQIDAVSKFIYDVGTALHQNYGCDVTTGWVYSIIYRDLQSVLNEFGYGPVDWRHRTSFSAVDWFNNVIIAELNQNRPLPYSITKHAVVVDGWQVIDSQPQYHVNYGWGTGGLCKGRGPCNIYYTLDEIYDKDTYPNPGDPSDEYALVNVKPNTALGASPSGLYLNEGGYFDQDATCNNAIFMVDGYTQGGVSVQFLPGITVSGSVNFYGPTLCCGGVTSLYSRGDQSKGVSLYVNGGIKITGSGSIRFP
jgi:hypothetical protein